MSIFNGRSVQFNFVMNVLLKVSSALCAALTYPFAFRMLGAEHVGKVAFMTSVVSFFSMLGSLGIPLYGIRECASVRDEPKQLSRTVKELLIIQGIMTAVSGVLLGTFVYAVPPLREEWRLCVIQGCVLLFGAVGTEWLFAGLEQYGYITLRSTAAKILALVLIFCLVRGPEDYMLYAGLLVLGTILPCLMNLIALKKVLPGDWFQQSGCSLIRHLWPILLFSAQTVSITIYTCLDTAMLGFMKGDYWTGIYDSAIKVKLILTFFVTSLGTVLLPRLSYYVHNRLHQEFRRQLTGSMEFTLVTGLSLVTFCFLMAPEIVEFLFGTGFLPGAVVLRILLPAVFIIGCSNITGTQMLIPNGREKALLWSVVVGAVVDLLLNAILIPTYAASGAAFGTLVAEMAVLAVQIWHLREELPEMHKHLHPAKPLLAISVASGAVLAIKWIADLPLLARLILSAGVFFLLTAGLLLIWKEPLLLAAVEEVKKHRRRDNKG